MHMNSSRFRLRARPEFPRAITSCSVATWRGSLAARRQLSLMAREVQGGLSSCQRLSATQGLGRRVLKRDFRCGGCSHSSEAISAPTKPSSVNGYTAAALLLTSSTMPSNWITWSGLNTPSTPLGLKSVKGEATHTIDQRSSSRPASVWRLPCPSPRLSVRTIPTPIRSCFAQLFRRSCPRLHQQLLERIKIVLAQRLIPAQLVNH